MPARTAYPLGTPPVWHGMARTQKDLGGVIPIVVADLVTGNTVNLFKVPANFVVTGTSIDFPQLDSGAGLTLSLGDAVSATRYLNASTAGRAATPSVPIAFGARGYKYLADSDIILTITAGAATPVAGSVVVYLHGYLEP